MTENLDAPEQTLVSEGGQSDDIDNNDKLVKDERKIKILLVDD